MMHEPVFRDSFEVDIWKRLISGRDSAAKKSDHYTHIAELVVRNEKPVNSAILSLLIEKLYETQSSGMDVLIEKLVSKRRPNDCIPALKAALVYVEMGRIDNAEKMVESVRRAQNIPMLGCVNARISIENGDTPRAKKELIAARCSDPTFPMFYELIQRLEPAEGWMHRQNIELMFAGKAQIPFGDNTGSSPVQKLYEIYRDWYQGKRDEATKAMIDSEEYKRKNSEYVLASARMSMDEKDWHSAQMMYSSLLTKSSNCVYIICEAAKAFYSGKNYEKALSLYREAEALDPISPMVMNGLIKAYSALGMKAEAAQCVKEFLDSENADLKAYITGAKTLLSNSYYSDAETIINKIHLSYPDNPEAFILKSELQYQTGNINSSLKTITNGAERNPDHAYVRLQKAKILFKTGKVDKAEIELEKARTADPNNKDVLILMKDIALHKKNTEEATKLSSRILEIDPTNVEAKNTLSKASLSNNRESTYAMYKDMIAADNRSDNFINVLSKMIADGKYGEAIQLFTEKEREFGKIPLVRRLKGNAEYAMGHYKTASASYASAAELDPKDPIIWHSKGMADEAMGDLKAAEEAYNKAVLLDMNEPEYWISRASVLEKKRDLAGAVESLNRAIELRPDEVYALVKKGMIFAEMGRYNEAFYFIDMALITQPNNVDVLRVHREMGMASGNLSKAEEAAVKITQIDPDDEEGTASAARLLMRKGKDDEAAEVVKTALRRNPQSITLLIVKKEIYISKGEYKTVIETCNRILSIQPDNEIVKRDLAEAYSEVGDHNAASRLIDEIEANKSVAEKQRIESQTTHKQKVPDAVKRYAERVLRRAYISKVALSDMDLTSALGLDDATTNAVMNYLSNITEYGDIIPGTPEYERMEKLSMNAVVKGNCTGLETDPVISIPCAFVAGGAKDADEAKLLVAYIYKALNTKKSSKAIPQDLRTILESTQKGTSIEEIMKSNKLGVYQAKLIKDNL